MELLTHRTRRFDRQLTDLARRPQYPVPHHCTTRTQHTHTIVLLLFWILSGTTQVSRYQKGKTNLDLLEQEIVSGSDICWTMCKTAPHPRQITTPTSHHSVFLQAGCPSCRPTNSVKALKADVQNKHTIHSSRDEFNIIVM